MNVKKALLPLVCFVTLVAGVVWAQEVTDIESQKAREMIDQHQAGLVLDVRTTDEFTGPLGHIPGSKLIPIQELEQRAGELSTFKNENVLVICRTGSRSKAASGFLIRNGFTKIFDIRDGMVGWTKNRFPIEKN